MGRNAQRGRTPEIRPTGEPLDLDQLDEDDNLVASILRDRYYATLAATWFGVYACGLFPAPPPLRSKPDAQLAMGRETRSESGRRSVSST